MLFKAHKRWISHQNELALSLDTKCEFLDMYNANCIHAVAMIILHTAEDTYKQFHRLNTESFKLAIKRYPSCQPTALSMP